MGTVKVIFLKKNYNKNYKIKKKKINCNEFSICKKEFI